MDVQPPLASLRPSTNPTTSYRTILSTQPSQVDYVIHLVLWDDRTKAERQLDRLIDIIHKVGLYVQVRPAAEPGNVLVFVKCPETRLRKEVEAARARDWLYGVSITTPIDESVENHPINDSERLRLVYNILTGPTEEGGASITVQSGQWLHVYAIFPLHNKDFDKAWLKRWSTKWTIDDAELEHLREHFGTKVAMYFAFLQFYQFSLAIPAGLGLIAFFLLPEYSVLYSVGVSAWAIIFVAFWERRQRLLAARWNVRHCASVEHRRAEFTGNEEQDPVTGKKVPVFSGLNRLLRELLVVPFVLTAGLVLASILMAIFAIEVFLGEVYDGPFKQWLVFTPTLLFTFVVGPFQHNYQVAAYRLTAFENHETDAAFNAAITRKVFVLNFMTSYTALFLTLYVYLPFGHHIVPKLDIFGITTAYSSYGIHARPFQLDPYRLRNQLFYFAVTAQVVNLAMEFLVPIIFRIVKGGGKELKDKFVKNKAYKPQDDPNEAAFLNQVREEADLPEYDQYTDYVEMVIQFGYTVLFSPIWPLTPLCAFLNNIVELRADAAKLCQNMRRPVPMRADSIGPWADNLVFLTWLGSLTTASIVYLLRGEAPWEKSFINMLAICLFAEHAYLLLHKCIHIVLDRFPNTAELQIHGQEYKVKQSQLSKLSTASAEKAEDTKPSIFSDDLQTIKENGKRLVNITWKKKVVAFKGESKKEL